MSSRSSRSAGAVLEAPEPPKVYGKETPRLFTPPLRELTPETSLGFDVIRFAETVLRITLRPWQKWLLIHGLELRPDGTYRFRKLCILVGRQNGKTMLMVVLCLYWLFVDSMAFPEDVKPSEFLVLGTAQDLDTAAECWERARQRCDPDPDEPEAIPSLQRRSFKPVFTNGSKALRARNGAIYRIKAANRKGARGKSAARILMDELREQHNFDAWSSVTKTKNAIFNSQLWAISNAGDAKSVVLLQLRTVALADLDRDQPLDPTLGIFEWSAPEGCDLDDPDAIAQANPSLGYGIEWETIMSDLVGDPEFVYRTEVLCQWVTAAVHTYIDAKGFSALADEGSEIDPESPMVIGVDTAADRDMSYVSVAGFRPDGAAHVEVVAQRPGMLWVPGFVDKLAKAQDIDVVAVQGKGAPSSEFITAFEAQGLEVFKVEGSLLGQAAGQFRDHVKAGTVFHRGQPVLDMAVGGALTKRLGDMQVWDRSASVVDIAPLVAADYALFALENHKTEARVSAYALQDGEDDEDARWW